MTSFALIDTRRAQHSIKVTGEGGGGCPVYALAISPSGTFLAAGDLNGVRLWHLASQKEVEVPSVWGIRGAVTSIVWLQRDLGETMIYGTSLGFLVCWRQNSNKFKELCWVRAGEQQITSVNIDPASGRIVSCIRDGTVSTWILDQEERLEGIFAVQVEKTNPIAVSIQGNTTKDLLLFTMAGK
ncbi:hypothetical protein GLOTRDRAFT_97366, partial [Gloeophyllum trabeum ATCC 11539]